MPNTSIMTAKRFLPTIKNRQEMELMMKIMGNKTNKITNENFVFSFK